MKLKSMKINPQKTLVLSGALVIIIYLTTTFNSLILLSEKIGDDIFSINCSATSTTTNSNDNNDNNTNEDLTPKKTVDLGKVLYNLLGKECRSFDMITQGYNHHGCMKTLEKEVTPILPTTCSRVDEQKIYQCSKCIYHASISTSNYLTQQPQQRYLRLFIASFLKTQHPTTTLRLWFITKSADTITRDEIQYKEGILALFCNSQDYQKEINKRIEVMSTLRLKPNIPQEFSRRFEQAKPIGFTDFFRFFVLKTYGGLYFDVDTIFTQDMLPFCGSAFTYWWPMNDTPNTAVMGSGKNGTFVNKYLEWAKTRESDPEPFHPRRIELYWKETNSQSGEDLYVLPTFLFDSLWYYLENGAKPLPSLYYDYFNGKIHFCDLLTKDMMFFQTLFSSENANNTFDNDDNDSKERTKHPLLRLFPNTFSYHFHTCKKPVKIIKNSLWVTIENYFEL